MSPDIDPPPPKRMSIHRTHSKFSGAVRLLLDIDRMDSWCVRTQPGAVRRIVMNLLGNSLKYTGTYPKQIRSSSDMYPSHADKGLPERGLVCVSLQPTKGSSRNKSSLSFCITVADTGKGMSTDFARHHAWEAFSQEDSFASGVGLGLSIVRYIAASLGGKIDLQSSVGKGTEIKILLTMPLGSAKEDETRNVVDLVGKSTHGLRLCMLDPGYASIHHGDADVNRRAVDTLQRMASSWFGMEVFKSPTIQGVQADFFMYVEPPSIEHLLQHHGLGTENTHVPLIMITPNAFESAALRNDTLKLKELGRTIDIISQPCGPQKLARALERCIYGEPSVTPSDIANTSLAGLRIDKGIRDTVFTPQHQSSSDFPDTRAPKPGLKRQDSFNPEPDVSSAGSEPPTDALSESVGASALIRFNTIHGTPSSTGDDKGSGTNRNPDRNPVLLVDDNEVNLRILCAFVRKAGFQYETAKDGLQALELYKKFNKDPKLASFEVIVMDVQMPVMDGVTATRKIRTYESRNRIKPATIVALTGLASEASRNECEKAGVDHFLSKPVKFKEFLKLLESVS
jgi:CheY-like chemotaxis protein